MHHESVRLASIQGIGESFGSKGGVWALDIGSGLYIFGNARTKFYILRTELFPVSKNPDNSYILLWGEMSIHDNGKGDHHFQWQVTTELA